MMCEPNNSLTQEFGNLTVTTSPAEEAILAINTHFASSGFSTPLISLIKSYSCDDDSLRSKRVCELFSERKRDDIYWEAPVEYFNKFLNENKEFQSLLAKLKILDLSEEYLTQEEREALAVWLKDKAPQVVQCKLCLYEVAPFDQQFLYVLKETLYQGEKAVYAINKQRKGLAEPLKKQLEAMDQMQFSLWQTQQQEWLEKNARDESVQQMQAVMKSMTDTATFSSSRA